MVNHALREAVSAVRKARRHYPNIDPRGVAKYADRYPVDHHCFHKRSGLRQIATAVHFLRATMLPSPRDSYGVKHDAERWGKEAGMAPYVSNGALIAAALYLDVPVKSDADGYVFLG